MTYRRLPRAVGRVRMAGNEIGPNHNGDAAHRRAGTSRPIIHPVFPSPAPTARVHAPPAWTVLYAPPPPSARRAGGTRVQCRRGCEAAGGGLAVGVSGRQGTALSHTRAVWVLLSTGGGRLGGDASTPAVGMAGRVPTTRRQWATAAAAGSGAQGGAQEATAGNGGFLATVAALWGRVVRPMQDFGFGRKSVWEGGVGLFIMAGAAFLVLLVSWVKGLSLRNRTQAYQVRPTCTSTTSTLARLVGECRKLMRAL